MAPETGTLDVLRKQLVVSCQPVTGGPLDRTDFVVGMAEAAGDRLARHHQLLAQDIQTAGFRGHAQLWPAVAGLRALSTSNL